MPVLLSLAKLDIVLGRVRKVGGGELMFNQDSSASALQSVRTALVPAPPGTLSGASTSAPTHPGGMS